MKQGNILYLVSPYSEEHRYSGTPGQRLYKTLLAAEARVRKVKEITGKRYFITRLEVGKLSLLQTAILKVKLK